MSQVNGKVSIEVCGKTVFKLQKSIFLKTIEVSVVIFFMLNSIEMQIDFLDVQLLAF